MVWYNAYKYNMITCILDIIIMLHETVKMQILQKGLISNTGTILIQLVEQFLW